MNRELIRWVQSLDLSYPIKNPRTDVGNGVQIAEILSRYDKGVDLHTYDCSGTGVARRLDNWCQIRKVLLRRGVTSVTEDMIDEAIQMRGDGAKEILQCLYEHLTSRRLQEQGKADVDDTTAIPITRGGRDIRRSKKLAVVDSTPSYARPTATQTIRECNSGTIERLQDVTGRTDMLQIKERNEGLLKEHKDMIRAAKEANPERYMPSKPAKDSVKRDKGVLAEGNTKGDNDGATSKVRQKIVIAKALDIKTVSPQVLAQFAAREALAKEQAVHNGFNAKEDLSVALSRVVYKILKSYGLVESVISHSSEDYVPLPSLYNVTNGAQSVDKERSDYSVVRSDSSDYIHDNPNDTVNYGACIDGVSSNIEDNAQKQQEEYNNYYTLINNDLAGTGDFFNKFISTRDCLSHNVKEGIWNILCSTDMTSDVSSHHHTNHTNTDDFGEGAITYPPDMITRNSASLIAVYPSHMTHLLLSLSYAFGRDAACLTNKHMVSCTTPKEARRDQWDIVRAFEFIEAIGTQMVIHHPKEAVEVVKERVIPHLLSGHLLTSGTTYILEWCGRIISSFIPLQNIGNVIDVAEVLRFLMGQGSREVHHTASVHDYDNAIDDTATPSSGSCTSIYVSSDSNTSTTQYNSRFYVIMLNVLSMVHFRAVTSVRCKNLCKDLALYMIKVACEASGIALPTEIVGSTGQYTVSPDSVASLAVCGTAATGITAVSRAAGLHLLRRALLPFDVITYQHYMIPTLAAQTEHNLISHETSGGNNSDSTSPIWNVSTCAMYTALNTIPFNKDPSACIMPLYSIPANTRARYNLKSGHSPTSEVLNGRGDEGRAFYMPRSVALSTNTITPRQILLETLITESACDALMIVINGITARCEQETKRLSLQSRKRCGLLNWADGKTAMGHTETDSEGRDSKSHGYLDEEDPLTINSEGKGSHDTNTPDSLLHEEEEFDSNYLWISAMLLNASSDVSAEVQSSLLEAVMVLTFRLGHHLKTLEQQESALVKKVSIVHDTERYSDTDDGIYNYNTERSVDKLERIGQEINSIASRSILHTSNSGISAQSAVRERIATIKRFISVVLAPLSKRTFDRFFREGDVADAFGDLACSKSGEDSRSSQTSGSHFMNQSKVGIISCTSSLLRRSAMVTVGTFLSCDVDPLLAESFMSRLVIMLRDSNSDAIRYYKDKLPKLFVKPFESQTTKGTSATACPTTTGVQFGPALIDMMGILLPCNTSASCSYVLQDICDTTTNNPDNAIATSRSEATHKSELSLSRTDHMTATGTGRLNICTTLTHDPNSQCATLTHLLRPPTLPTLYSLCSRVVSVATPGMLLHQYWDPFIIATALVNYTQSSNSILEWLVGSAGEQKDIQWEGKVHSLSSLLHRRTCPVVSTQEILVLLETIISWTKSFTHDDDYLTTCDNGGNTSSSVVKNRAKEHTPFTNTKGRSPSNPTSGLAATIGSYTGGDNDDASVESAHQLSRKSCRSRQTIPPTAKKRQHNLANASCHVPCHMSVVDTSTREGWVNIFTSLRSYILGPIIDPNSVLNRAENEPIMTNIDVISRGLGEVYQAIRAMGDTDSSSKHDNIPSFITMDSEDIYQREVVQRCYRIALRAYNELRQGQPLRSKPEGGPTQILYNNPLYGSDNAKGVEIQEAMDNAIDWLNAEL